MIGTTAPSRIVLTSWMRGPDRQRGDSTSPLSARAATSKLRASLTGCELKVFSNDDSGDLLVDDLGMGIYQCRWIHFYRWLKENSSVKWVWCVDASDVIQLREPWGQMHHGVIHSGWEEDVVGSSWMLQNHPSRFLQEFLRENAEKPLLNCGVFGGDRCTILELLKRWVILIEDNERQRFDGSEIFPLGADMGPYNYLLATYFPNRFLSGPQVTTTFKAGADNGVAWWKHK